MVVVKRLAVARAVLDRAAFAISVGVPEDLQIDDPAIVMDVHRARHVLLVAFLEREGNLRAARGGFWRDLMRACEALQLPDELARCRDSYRGALQRVGATVR